MDGGAVGVEEEFFLVDATGRLVTRAHEALVPDSDLDAARSTVDLRTADGGGAGRQRAASGRRGRAGFA
ncbi:hypothetical protein [Alloactinosynnema sp. L-07]|uniref:hypothetical protein n=1 Tax=Alloactinosynnema sp. L-07 TaxID=1653480 RepID=UPI00065F0594|nr:hypothetical protein [Alloactinosynnema sp. L-07]CRK57579.1 hypothetical protein [Alloactinosynnema sp. L-07]